MNSKIKCNHYERNCSIISPCCKKEYGCRLCHDENEDHEMNRYQIANMKCLKCFAVQTPSQFCKYCFTEMASYYCDICKFWNNDKEKDIYHCDYCNICRIGLGLGKDKFHCDKCNLCLSIDVKDTHKCVENTSHSNCPICCEYMFTSREPLISMKCGHCIHQSCFDRLIQNDYRCPLCKQSVCDMSNLWEIMSNIINESSIPIEYENATLDILCNDCSKYSNVKFNFMTKCEYCESWNTTTININMNDDESEIDNDTEITDETDTEITDE